MGRLRMGTQSLREANILASLSEPIEQKLCGTTA